MRIPSDRSGGPICEFDRTVTPMVDVVFQLLIFFVLASGGRFPEQTLSTTLAAGTISSQGVQPSGHDAGRKEPAAENWIHLRRDPATMHTIAELDGRRYSEVAALKEPLRKLAVAGSQNPVVLDAAGDVALGDVIQLDDLCRSAGLNSINFAASPDELASRGLSGIVADITFADEVTTGEYLGATADPVSGQQCLAPNSKGALLTEADQQWHPADHVSR